ncbi:DNA recombination protein RmuC, partial [Rhizobium ruizarguesonis]
QSQRLRSESILADGNHVLAIAADKDQRRAGGSVDMVVTSADKLTRRGARIEALEFEAGSGDAKPARDSEAAVKSVE